MKKLFLILLALVVFGSTTVVQARDGIGLTPAVSEVVIEEGETSASFVITVFNNSSSVAILKLSTLDFGSLDESGGLAFLGASGQESRAFGLSKWMKPDKELLNIEPSKSEEVKVTITDDGSLSPGGHYGAVVVSAVQGEGQDSDSVAVLPAASSLVLLNKRGGEVRQLELGSVSAKSSLVKLPESVVLRFRNTGNTHLVPRGTVELMSPTGKLLSRTAINESSSYILPDTYRKFDVTMSNQARPWSPGRYKLVTTWRYDGTDNTEVHEQYYWYAGKLLIYASLALVAAVAITWYIRYRRRPVVRGR